MYNPFSCNITWHISVLPLSQCASVYLDLYVSDILSANICFVKFCVFMYGEGQLGISSKMRVKKILQVGWKQR